MTQPTLPAYLTEHEDGTVSVRLGRKVSICGVEVEEVRLRELTLRDQIAATKAAGGDGTLEHDVQMLCLVLDGATPDQMRDLPRRVFSRLQDGLRLFFV